MERLRRSVAVASGKGGVGKSTTALNLAVQYAKSGMRVALADLDPLSNLTTILDVANTRFDYSTEEVRRKGLDLSRFSYRVFDRLDLLFPRPSERSEESIAMRTLLFRHLREQIETRYDIVLLDMPAGIDHDENLAFLPLVETILVVVQPEPTSHVSAGGYIRAAIDVAPQASILLWHNKYNSLQEGRFDPRAVITNYNRYVGPQQRIATSEAARIVDIAFVPHDPSLDLLQTRFSFEATLYHRMLGMLEMIVEELTPSIRTVDGHYSPARHLLRTRLVRDTGPIDTGKTLKRLESYLGEMQSSGIVGARRTDNAGGVEVLTADERSVLLKYLESLAADRVRAAAVHARDLINTVLDTWGDSSREHQSARGRALEKRTIAALRALARDKRRARPALRNAAGCLLLYVSVHKLLASDRIRGLLRSFVPVRRDEQGKLVRDRYRQIRSLIEHDEQYHRRFFELVKRFFPIVIGQLRKLIETQHLQPLVLRSKTREVHRTAYLKLLTTWMHDTANSGLGITVGMAHTTAARTIQDGAKALAQSFDSPPQRVGDADDDGL
ncbi:MAG: AAA family ATPase [Spirochaetes bacterium]|jgi:flagellar biosynthesis protein FlhG|nr:AAA family ATPase [Spirochaetota bacterium]